jgi:hypothetical protein
VTQNCKFLSLICINTVHNTRNGITATTKSSGRQITGITVITFAIAVMSRSGVLGYHSGSGLLFGCVAFTAQTGDRFSLVFDGETNRRASGFLAPLTARAPGEDTLLMKKPPPPVQNSLKAAPLPSLNSVISEHWKQHASDKRQIRQNPTDASKVPHLPGPNPCPDSTQLILELPRICKNGARRNASGHRVMGEEAGE